MPRLGTVDPNTDSCTGAEMLNGPLKEMQINIFKGLASHPAVLESFLAWAAGSKGGSLTPAEHELLALFVGESNECAYCTAAHTMIAEGTGLNGDIALEARRGTSSDPRHQALLDFTSTVMQTKGHVSNDQLQTFKDAGFDDNAAIEVIAAISVNTFTNFYNHVHATEVDFPAPPKA